MGETPRKNGAGRPASVFSGPDRLKAGRRTRFVAWVERERERLAQEFLELKYDSKSVTEITRMFTERVMFCPEFTSEQAQMSRYLSMLKGGVSDSSCLRRGARPCWYRRRPPCGVS